jgi:hypothetical protein
LESVIQKTIRSSEGNLIGNVDAVDENSILVSTEDGRTRYKIPKNNLQVLVRCVLERFKGGKSEGFREVK